MTPSQPEPCDNSGRIERIDGRLESLSEDISEIKCDIKQSLKENSEFRLYYTERHAELKSKVNDHQNRLEKIEAIIENLKPMLVYSKILIFLSSILMTSIIAMIVAIITHQVTLVIP